VRRDGGVEVEIPSAVRFAIRDAELWLSESPNGVSHRMGKLVGNGQGGGLDEQST
jgi:hypothetical protein